MVAFLHFKNIYLFFNWRIIALQNWVVFCQTSTWISHRYMYVLSLLNLPSISLPIPLLWWWFNHQIMSYSCHPKDQALLSMGFPRQEYWSRLPFPSPLDLPNPGIEPESPPLQADYLPWATWEAPRLIQSPCLSSMRHTANSHWLSILHMVM